MIYRHEDDQPCLRKYVDDHHKDPGQQHSGPPGSGNHKHVVHSAFIFFIINVTSQTLMKDDILQSLN